MSHTGSGDLDPRWLVPWWATVLFVVLACGGAWLVVLPLWRSGDGLAHPLAVVLLPAMMFTPAAAAAVVLALLGRRRPRPVLAFLGVWPIRPTGRTIRWTLLAYVGGLLLPVAALAVAVWAGWFRLDPTGFSGFRALLRQYGAAHVPVPIELLVVAQLAQLPVVAALNAFVTVGEELGWRGFLVPALRRAGRWPALVVSGVVWGLWHTPVILLGYDFGRTDWIGPLYMVIACGLLGVVLGWTRLRSGSVWPAVFAHAGLNGAAGIGAVVGASGQPLSDVLRNPLGVAGWVVLVVVVALLLLTRAFRLEAPLTPPAPATAARVAGPGSSDPGTP